MNSNEHKWLIPSPYTSEYFECEKAGWNIIHQNYSRNTYSLTQEPKNCQIMISPSENLSSFKIPDSPDIQILIPGCGSEIELQKTLLNYCPHIGQVCCTDFSDIALEKATKNWLEANENSKLINQKLSFKVADSTRLTEHCPDWNGKFDYVLVANSVLSAEDDKNRQMIGEFYKALKPGGRLYGFFPTIYWDLEIAYLIQSKAYWLTEGLIHLPHSAAYDKTLQDRQIYYTPLRLNRIFKEAGFKRLSFEICFDDSDIACANLEKVYGIEDPDIYHWGFFVRFEK